MRAWVWAVLASCSGDVAWTLPADAPAEAPLVGPVGQAPPPGFQLEVNNLAAGDYAELHVTGAPPGQLLRVVYGRLLGDGPCPAALDDLCLGVTAPVHVAAFGSIADADGEAWITFRIPRARTATVALQVTSLGPTPAVSNPVQRPIAPFGGGLDSEDNDADGYTPNDGDCGDFDAAFHPGAYDVAGDGLDLNCDDVDGEDGDGDSFASVASGGVDCDDAVPEIHPEATEVCNGDDDDCDGVTNPASAEGAVSWYVDVDGDNHGTGAGSILACDRPSGYGAFNDDCNDASSAIYPGRAETCQDGLDNDCDAVVDDGCGPLVVSFTTVGSTSWTVPSGVTTVQVLVVGGGGGGGTGRGSGGGGAGGFVQNAAFAVTPGQVIPVTVGAGGAGGTTSSGSGNGQASVFGTITAAGGGAGGNFTGGGALVGGAGGSGGGGAGGASSAGGLGTAGQGRNGGGGSSGAGGCYFGGGGGGAGAAGTNAASGCTGGPGTAGVGLASTITGASVYYAGGGGAGPWTQTTGSNGGLGGGGGAGGSLVNGNQAGPPVVGGAGAANTGGGGGGGGYGYSSATSYAYYGGGAGGSGVVILRYCASVGCVLPTL